MYPRIRSAGLWACGLLVSTALGKTPNPLERITPVLVSEPIPLIDYFRSPIFRSLQLNDAGTHFLALVFTHEDRTDAVSFGEFLPISGACCQPGLYWCAITIAGVFDWERVMKESRRNSVIPLQYGFLRRNLGDSKTEVEKFEEISPLRHVGNVKTPIYVAQGTGAVIASVAQSLRLVDELKKHGVPHEKQIERHENHGFAHPQKKVELHPAVEAFLAKHMTSRQGGSTGVT